MPLRERSDTVQSFVVGAGCFWCIDAVYRNFRGIISNVVGYTGGDLENPDYMSVCSGQTGHVEVDEVTFDETVIPAEVILDIFFTSHDPTSWDQQGHDVGSQYRSALYYRDEEQKKLFEEAKSRAEEFWSAPIVTVIEPLQKFWKAEEVHQNFYANNPYSGYCMAIVNPKISKARKEYAAYLL